MKTALVCRSYAKINLYLDILKRRRDGYHNIETVFQTVGLADELTFTAQQQGIAIESSRLEVPCDRSNLAYRAAALLQTSAGCTRGVHIRIVKHIPVAAGLAGGSGNAAATLIALNRLWELRLSPAHIRRLALQLGSDVPYCLAGGTMAATRRGEELAPLPPLSGAWFVLIHPPFEVSTSAVYANPLLPRNSEPPFAGRTASFRRFLRALARNDWAAALYNSMESTVFEMHPELAEAKERLRRKGCHAAAMSGSGPTIFGVCDTREEAESVARGFGTWPTTIAPPAPCGVEIVG